MTLWKVIRDGGGQKKAEMSQREKFWPVLDRKNAGNPRKIGFGPQKGQNVTRGKNRTCSESQWRGEPQNGLKNMRGANTEKTGGPKTCSNPPT